MDSERLRRAVARIEALDRGRFETAVAERLKGSDCPPALAGVISGSLLGFTQSAPNLLELMARWADKAGIAAEMKPLLGAAESYFRRPDDELDEQRLGLEGLLDDAYLVGKLAEQCAAAGMPLPAGFALAESNGLIAVLLGEDVVARLHARLADAARPKPVRPPLAPAPRPVAAPVAELDRRLFGTWHHSTCYSSGGFSYSNTRSRLFGSNGRYVEGGQSFVNMVHRDSAGDEVGRSAASGAPADERGRWSTEGTRLTLEADNGDVFEFRFEVHPDALLLSQAVRDAKLWTRDQPFQGASI